MTNEASLGRFSDIAWLTDNWWLVLLRGIAAILFGILTFLWPALSLLSIVLLWGAFALVDGIFAIATAFLTKRPDAGSRWWMGLVGLLGVAAGLLTFFAPAVTAFGLLTFFAAWLIATGILQIVGAIRLRKAIDNEWMLALSGLASVILGALLIGYPLAGLVTVAWMIGIFALAVGIFYIGLSLRLKKVKNAFAA
ncbi:MAG: HdeD family acid-resistance protein [Sphingobium sp.]